MRSPATERRPTLSLHRLRASALIVEDDAVLLVEFDDESGLHYNLPGGGVEPGESIPEAVRREASEEAAVSVTVGELAMVYEYVPHRDGGCYGPRPLLNLIFACTLADGSRPRLPAVPDPHQTGVHWVPLAELPTVVLYPEIQARIQAYCRGIGRGERGHGFVRACDLT